jgi:hypothetical protein
VIETMFAILAFAGGWWLRGVYDRTMDNVR